MDPIDDIYSYHKSAIDQMQQRFIKFVFDCYLLKYIIQQTDYYLACLFISAVFCLKTCFIEYSKHFKKCKLIEKVGNNGGFFFIITLTNYICIKKKEKQTFMCKTFGFMQVSINGHQSETIHYFGIMLTQTNLSRLHKLQSSEAEMVFKRECGSQ